MWLSHVLFGSLSLLFSVPPPPLLLKQTVTPAWPCLYMAQGWGERVLKITLKLPQFGYRTKKNIKFCTALWGARHLSGLELHALPLLSPAPFIHHHLGALCLNFDWHRTCPDPMKQTKYTVMVLYTFGWVLLQNFEWYRSFPWGSMEGLFEHFFMWAWELHFVTSIKNHITNKPYLYCLTD